MLSAYIQRAGVPDVPGLSETLHDIAKPWTEALAETGYGAS